MQTEKTSSAIRANRRWLPRVLKALALRCAIGGLLTQPTLMSAAAGEGAAGGSAALTLASELQRMRSAEHLYLPQAYRLRQFSGFSRAGGNPDRFDSLYREGDWLVYADQEGPGVVSRIWATHGEEWQEIRIEVDGKVIYEGKADGFFGMARAPFVAPLCEIRSATAIARTAEGEKGKLHVWGVSYVPIPFQARFRYLQKKQVYTNVNIKVFAPGTNVVSFPAELSEAERKELALTAEVWRSQKLPVTAAPVVSREFVLPAVGTDGKDVASVPLRLSGAGVIRSIRVWAEGAGTDELADLTLHARWDDAVTDAIAVPLDAGLGSVAQRTLALGRDEDGAQFIRLPMPFRQAAEIRVSSRLAKTQAIRLEVMHEAAPQLPAGAMYLHAQAADGQFTSGKDQYAHPDVPAAEFLYHNGHIALDRRGAGQIVAYMDRYECQPELDEHIFVDDERRFPDNWWNGTGHEDLFDMAWGHKTMSSAMASGGSQKFGEANVKLFWSDPLTFRTGVRFNWEWSYKVDVPPPRDARFRSVVYYYAPAAAEAR